MEENFFIQTENEWLSAEEELKREALIIKQKRKQEKTALQRVSAFIGLAYFLQTVAPFFITFGMTVLFTAIGLQNEYAKLMENSGVLMVLQILLSVIAFVFPYMLVSMGSNKKPWQLLCMGKPEKGTFLPLVLMGLGFSAFGNVAANAIKDLFSMLGINFSSPDFSYPSGFFGAVLSLIAIGIIPALVEEFAMRGMVMGGLRPFGKGFAIVVSAGIFGMMHGNFIQMPFAFIVGLALGFATVKSGSIWTAVTIHFLNNTLSLSLDYLLSLTPSVNHQMVLTTMYFVGYILCFFVGVFLTCRNKDFWKSEKTETYLSVREQYVYFFFSPVIIVDIIITLFMSLAYVSI